MQKKVAPSATQTVHDFTKNELLPPEKTIFKTVQEPIIEANASTTGVNYDDQTIEHSQPVPKSPANAMPSSHDKTSTLDNASFNLRSGPSDNFSAEVSVTSPPPPPPPPQKAEAPDVVSTVITPPLPPINHATVSHQPLGKPMLLLKQCLACHTVKKLSPVTSKK